MICQKIKNIYDQNTYEIYECKFCNIAFTKSKSSLEVKNIYKDAYDYDVNQIIKNEKIWRIENNFNKIKKKINITKNSYVLDIGCMYGYFLEYLNRYYGCNCNGLEIESFNLSNKKKKNITIFNEDLFKFSSKAENSNKYDFIILSHSLEHFEYPLSVVDSINKLLKKNGFCYIVVPNFKSKISIFTKKYWAWLQPSVHFFHYNPVGLISMIEKEGFILKYNSNQGGDSLFLLLTLFNFFNDYLKITKKIYRKSYLKKIVIKLSSIIFKYMYYIGNDESLFLFQKK